MIVTVMTIHVDPNTKEVMEKPREIYKKDLACLYYCNGQSYISLMNGTLLLTKHTLYQLEKAFEL